MIVNCSYCNVEFEKPSSEIKRSTRSDHHFCCREHYDLFRVVVGNKEYKCAYCHGKIVKSISLQDKRVNHFCSRECYNRWRSENLRGESNYNPKSKDRKEVICPNCGKSLKRAIWRFTRTKNQFCSQSCKKEYMIGANSGFWKGGWRNQIYRRIRGLKKYETWRTDVLFRDDSICQHCGSLENLDVHHKKELMDIIREFHLKTIKDANECKALWDVNNGITLCVHCHAEEHPDLRHLFCKRIA